MSRKPTVQSLTLPPTDDDVRQSPGSANSTSFLISPSFEDLYEEDHISYTRQDHVYYSDLICREVEESRRRARCEEKSTERLMLTPRGSVLPALADGAGTRKNMMYNDYERFMMSSMPMSE